MLSNMQTISTLSVTNSEPFFHSRFVQDITAFRVEQKSLHSSWCPKMVFGAQSSSPSGSRKTLKTARDLGSTQGKTLSRA
jgi:hypothetical protein